MPCIAGLEICEKLSGSNTHVGCVETHRSDYKIIFLVCTKPSNTNRYDFVLNESVQSVVRVNLHLTLSSSFHTEL
jgi:hypothetical protein